MSILNELCFLVRLFLALQEIYTMSDGGDKDVVKEFIKSGVNAANDALSKAQTTFHQWQEPISSTKQTIEENSAVVYDTVKTVYYKRKSYAPEIIGGSTLLFGGYNMLRRGRIAGMLGAAIGGAAAYSVVYDELPPIDVDKIQGIVFGKKDE